MAMLNNQRVYKAVAICAYIFEQDSKLLSDSIWYVADHIAIADIFLKADWVGWSHNHGPS